MDRAFDREGSVRTEIPLSEKQKDYYPLIESPPPASLAVACVIPVYQEFQNGNVFRMIEAFTKQINTSDGSSTERITSDQFELIFVVNNRQIDFQDNTEVFEENRKTLQA